MSKGKFLGLAGLAGLAAGAFALFKVGEKKLAEESEEKETDDISAAFDGEDIFAETAEDSEDDEAEFSDDEADGSVIDTVKNLAEDACENAAKVCKTIKVGFVETFSKAKSTYGDYREDPEAFKEKAKAKVSQTKEKVTSFASEKFGEVKDFAKEKIDNLKDVTAWLQQ